jgi:hypothetical protein
MENLEKAIKEVCNYTISELTKSYVVLHVGAQAITIHRSGKVDMTITSFDYQGCFESFEFIDVEELNKTCTKIWKILYTFEDKAVNGFIFIPDEVFEDKTYYCMGLRAVYCDEKHYFGASAYAYNCDGDYVIIANNKNVRVLRIKGKCYVTKNQGLSETLDTLHVANVLWESLP